MPRISIIGAGNVGASIAYACLLTRVAPEILLVDIDQQRCEAQVLDIQDTAFISDCDVRVGTFKEAGQSDIVVVSAGAKQRPGEPRTELIDRNYRILESCLSEMKPFKPSTVLLLVSNPVDVLTSIAQKLSGLPPNQVIGTGTFLDSSRLRAALSTRLQVAETAIHAYVLGEHGDSQFVAWSTAHVANIPLLEHPAIKQIDLPSLAQETMRKAYKIIEAKGATYYGIGGCTASICSSILGNTLQVRPVSHFIPSLGVCLSLPAAIGSAGVTQTLTPHLSPQEHEKLLASANALKAVLAKFV